MMSEVIDQEAQRFGYEKGIIPDIQMWITRNRNDDHRRYNAPSCNEIAIVFRNNDGEPPADRDIAIHPRRG